MTINFALIFIFGLFLTALFTFFLKRKSLRRKILLQCGIPISGGLAITFSFLITLFFATILFGRFSREIVGFMAASSIMFVFGLIDDIRELSVISKFVTQIIASGILIYFGERTHIVYLGNSLNMLVTFLWLVGITNAINHLDVMDGLAAGTSFIVSVAFFIISVINHDTQSLIIALILASTASGFLVFNLPPAKIYMGNSGSHFLGFSLAGLALLISYAPLERKIALFSPVAILWFPIFDTLFLMLLRIRKGRSVFKKSNDHFVLRLLKSGYSKESALRFMLIVASFFSTCGLLLSQTPNIAGVFVILVIILFSFILYKRVGSI